MCLPFILPNIPIFLDIQTLDLTCETNLDNLLNKLAVRGFLGPWDKSNPVCDQDTKIVEATLSVNSSFFEECRHLIRVIFAKHFFNSR